MTRVVGDAWDWPHREKQDIIIRSFECTWIILPVDGSRDMEISIKWLPELVIGDWVVGDLDCNLDCKGKTCDGELNLDDTSVNFWRCYCYRWTRQSRSWFALLCRGWVLQQWRVGNWGRSFGNWKPTIHATGEWWAAPSVHRFSISKDRNPR